MAITTRKVIPSLGVGIIAGVLLLHNFNPLDSISYLWSNVLALFWSEGELNEWNVLLIAFLLLLGILSSIIQTSGGARAFGEWAAANVKTARGARLVSFGLGILIFIDDYFNSLAVGNISRPLTDRKKVSRAKLAYTIDSTAAPVCVISPLSSWGAYIIALIAGILAKYSIDSYSSLSAFIQMIPMNFYAIFALLLTGYVAFTGLAIGPMRTHELRALKGELYDVSKGAPMGMSEDIKEHDGGKVRDLIVPILVLIVATVSAMLFTGGQALAADGQAFSLLGAFEATDVTRSLVAGAIISLIVTFLLLIGRKIPAGDYGRATWAGVRAMWPAVLILLFAWTIIAVIGDMRTGDYLASFVTDRIAASYLPLILFAIAGLMAFSTGTSWGTFGLMLPIGADLIMAVEPELLLPTLAAVLAGAVFGDHCSPISDTTILSSTGAGSHHIDHVLTQLPYASIAAGVSAVGYLVLGMTASMWIGFFAAFATFVVLLVIAQIISKRGHVPAEMRAEREA
ncbi:Na+/H+ antiporter NhaC family protein [Exiguobacterium sp. s122]|uniref:Na+/H+ antiporter NhaC family protein n=1 Tax=Exiguobacterium sp. s122 TaxID=2751220 RepID=UPI00333AF5B0